MSACCSTRSSRITLRTCRGGAKHFIHPWTTEDKLPVGDLERRERPCLNKSCLRPKQRLPVMYQAAVSCTGRSVDRALAAVFACMCACCSLALPPTLKPQDYTLPSRANYVLSSLLCLLLQVAPHRTHDQGSTFPSASCWSDKQRS